MMTFPGGKPINAFCNTFEIKTCAAIRKRSRIFHLLCILAAYWILLPCADISGQSAREYIFSGGRLTEVEESCAATLPVKEAFVSKQGGTGTVAVSSDNSCYWTATVANDASSWITITGGGSGTGSRLLSYTVEANPDWPRTGIIIIDHYTFTITQGGAACQNACNVEEQSCYSYLSQLASSCGSYCNGLAEQYQCYPNNSCYELYYGPCMTSCMNPIPMCAEQHTSCMSSCDNACGYQLAQANNTIGAGAGAGSVGIVSSGKNCSWAAWSNVSWITISPASKSGINKGIVEYSVDANNGISRNGIITIAGKTHTINQADGCTYSNISPASVSPVASGVTGSVSVTCSNANCTPVITNIASWITNVSVSGSGTTKTVNYTVTANTGPARSATIIIGGNTFTVNQENGCTYTISPSSASPGAGGGTSSVNVTSPNGSCPWTTTNNAPSWINNVTGSGSGDGAVSYTATANTGPARTGTITIAGKTFTVNQENGCAYTLPTSGASATAAGGAGSASVNCSGGSCQWTAMSNSPSWITNVTGSGTGSGAVSYTVAGNTGSSTRTGTITIGGQTFTVTQAGCAYTLPTSGASATAAGGAGSTSVDCSGGSCQWTATSNSPSWITNVKGSGTGSGAVSYTVTANTGPARSGTITIAGKTFTVSQADGCTYSLSPTSSGTINITGGSGNFTVTPGNNACTWTTSKPSWVNISSGSSGTGTGQVSYSVGNNSSGPSRSGTITIGGETYAVSQDGIICSQYCSQIAQACSGGCSSGCQAQLPPECYNYPAGCMPFFGACTANCSAQCSSVYQSCMASCQ